MARRPIDQSLLSATNLGRVFQMGSQPLQAVHNVDIDIYPGEFVALVGRSGSGKTTLLNLLGGLDTPTSGHVLFEGQDLSSLPPPNLLELRRKKIGFVFQSFGLLPLLSSYENVELPLRIIGETRKNRQKRVEEVLEMVQLTHRAGHRPYELSGGEQQRVAIARSIVNEPPLVLADEPTGELDSLTATSIFQLFREIADRQKVSIIATTHDETIINLATTVKELRDGTIVGQ